MTQLRNLFKNLLNYETNSIFDWLENIGKTGWKATGVGFVIDGLRNSAERSELIKMVTNNEIKYEGRLVKKTKY